MEEEANVENFLTRGDRYYCHKCQVEIRNLLPGFQCPTCQYGFVEVMEQQEHNEESDSSFSDVDDFHPVEMLSTILSSELAGSHNDRGRNRGSRRHRERIEPVENILQDLLLNLTGLGWAGQWNTQGGHLNLGANTGTYRNAGGGGPVLFLGNPGDYAWSREGLDAIVTQLLNQMDGTGPPPLAKDKIQQIPVVIITQDQVDSSLQCSVCWEDFKVSEEVRKLPCEHVYHSACIIPWLELHGTCPICRQTLSEGGDGGAGGAATNAGNDSAATAAATNNLGPLATFFRNLQDASPQGRSLSNAVLGSIAAAATSPTAAPSSSSSSSSSPSTSSNSSRSTERGRRGGGGGGGGGSDIDWTEY